MDGYLNTSRYNVAASILFSSPAWSQIYHISVVSVVVSVVVSFYVKFKSTLSYTHASNVSGERWRIYWFDLSTSTAFLR